MNLKLLTKFGGLMGVVLLLVAACTSTPAPEGNASESAAAEPNGDLAIVQSVTVGQREGHYYATITGDYPDACTYVSSVEQEVEGSTISINIRTQSPPDVMCAAVITPFTVDVLLATGGLMPGNYTVVVNDGPSTTFALG